jgi:hypothetical protein
MVAQAISHLMKQLQAVIDFHGFDKKISAASAASHQRNTWAHGGINGTQQQLTSSNDFCDP